LFTVFVVTSRIKSLEDVASGYFGFAHQLGGCSGYLHVVDARWNRLDTTEIVEIISCDY